MKISRIAVATIIVSLGFAFGFARIATPQTSELRLLSSDGMKPAIEDLLPGMEQSVRRRITAQFDASKKAREKIQAGEAFDVAILLSDDMDALIKSGKIIAGTRADVARFGIGIGVRGGTAKPDISTPEAFKRTLIDAKSIALNPNGGAAPVLNKILDRLGIAEEVKPKLIFDAAQGGAQAMVAEGKAELVISLIPAIAFHQGLELAGPLPADLQSYENFDAGIAANTHDQEPAKALIKYITSSAAAPIWKAKKAEPR